MHQDIQQLKKTSGLYNDLNLGMQPQKNNNNDNASFHYLINNETGFEKLSAPMPYP